MRAIGVFRRIRRLPNRSSRGQSLVEFALTLPMLIVLFLGVADFARVFQAGVTLEGATRNAAESAALRRLRDGPPSPPGDAGYYTDLHLLAARAACAEARRLPNVVYVPDDPGTAGVNEEQCPADFSDATASNDGVVIAVCIRDDLDGGGGGGDPDCTSSGAWVAPWVTGPIPPECGSLSNAWNPASGGESGSHAVEVRTCYHFTTLFSLHFGLPLSAGISVGDVWLQKSRVFVVDCPPGPVTGC